ncbi:hypothetical protein [Deinococcus ruber]|uniref:Uncharacterized protein n=1 Tax=Deinococcus ruber TaxID=1848197 RepID=A0A918FIL8_9DEIO|nr:hypothetical protein [Deinococcus ruber]GGR40148.1 hypothetical protein GCM10008957_55900 [Deinococcus ruber]
MNRTLIFTLVFTLATSAVAADLHGAVLIGADGTFLGTCDGIYGATSITNTASPYGNLSSKTSIFNTHGPYGSSDGPYSAFKQGLVQPPYVVRVDPEFLTAITSPDYRPDFSLVQSLEAYSINRVTINGTVSYAINPNELRDFCANP